MHTIIITFSLTKQRIALYNANMEKTLEKYNITIDFDEEIETSSPMLALVSNIVCMFECPYFDSISKEFSGKTIAIRDDKKITCQALPFGLIHITTGFMEELWCNCYFDYSLCMQVPLNNPEIPGELWASRSVKWTQDMVACEQQLKSIYKKCEDRTWHVDLPKPISNYNLKKANARTRDYVTEVFLWELLVCLLHEIKHISISDKTSLYKEEEEKACDMHAVKLLMKLRIEDNRLKYHFFKKRMLAIVSLAGMFISNAVYSDGKDDNHPHALSRLDSFISSVSKIFSCKNDLEYDALHERYDIRPVIQYAAHIMYWRLQYFALNLAEGSIKTNGINILNKVYNNPFELYISVRSYLYEFCESRWKNPQ